MHIESKQRTFWIATTLIAVAALLYCSWPLGFWLNPLAMRSGLASELGAFGQPHNWVFIWGDIISGALLVVGCTLAWPTIGKFRAARWGLGLLAVYGICGALDAGLPLHCVPSQEVCGPIFHDPLLVMHGAIDYTGSLALLGTLLIAWRLNHQNKSVWLPWIYAIGLAGVIFALLSLFFIITNGPGWWAQRYYLTISSVWVASLPLVLRSTWQRLATQKPLIDVAPAKAKI